MKNDSMEQEQTQLLLRLPAKLKADLQAEADRQGRKLTQEINIRLRISLGAHGPTLQTILAREEAARTAPGIAPSAPNTPHTTGPQGQAVHLSEHDMAMLRVFHAMPVEKQLALLSLFK
ncbi:MAG: hypothetical protein Q8M05_13030 [Rhodoferax sp.]|nr:hypothetical protein [Rhodoferax sp.]MDP1530298.1 hypothetical protein [Rhodoferax sp.]MDP1943355.1 hypothetical protein [Rhodoferax sp.]